ncbi:ABC transporter ATP-binding protein, partial [Staphylococcus saprophyticus]
NINNNSIKIYIDRNDTNIILNNLIKHNYKILEVKDE